MRIERIDHVAIMVNDLQKAESFFSDLLGTKFISLGENRNLDIVSLIEPNGIELIKPFLPDGPSAKALRDRGEGLALLSLKVENLDEAMNYMKEKGVRLVRRLDKGKFRLAVYHPADTFGVMIELIEYESIHSIAMVLPDMSL